MKITPVASPSAIKQGSSNPQAEATAKARAITMLTKVTDAQPQQSQQHPVLNPSQVTLEEFSNVQRSAEPVISEAPEQTQVVTEAQEAPTQTQEEVLATQQRAVLARREKALRQKAQQEAEKLRVDRQVFEAERAEFQKQKAQVDNTKYISRDQFKQNPLQVLAEAGVSYDELTQQIINQGSIDPRVNATIDELKSEIKALKQANEEAKGQMTEREQQAYQAALNQIKQDARQLVQKDPAFATIKTKNAVKEVVDLIERNYKETGEVLSIEEAAIEVENELVERSIKEHMELTKIDKIRQRLNLPSTAAKPQAQQPTSQAKQPQTMKTLTNTTSSSRQLSARERAMLAFNNQLK
jgi:hypothetical protein